MTTPPFIRRMLAFDTILLVMFLDQFSKWYVIQKYFWFQSFEAPGPTLDFIPWLIKLPQEQFPFVKTEVTSYFNLVMVWNKGVSFGMFSSAPEFMPYVLMAFAILLSGVFIVWLWKSIHWLATFSLSFIIAGALSNAWDRVRFGAVADFLDFHLNNLHYPSFNLADSAIVAGVAGLAFYTLVLEPKIKRAVHQP